MRGAAEGRDAADLSAAASALGALGALGASCAGCHGRLGGPKIAVSEPPPEASGTAVHTRRHQWAIDTMWAGLMGPSDEAWVKGAEAMATAPLTAESIVANKTVTPDLAAQAEAAHALARGAVVVEKSARGKAFANLMLTCAGCHNLVRNK